VAGHCAVVVEPEQLDHIADVGLAFDPARRRPLRIGEDRMWRDPALLSQVGPDLLGERKVGGVVPVQVADLTPPELEGELAAATRPCLDAWPGGDFLDDLLAGRARFGRDCLLEGWTWRTTKR
jgi:hypothetical protein